jgi:signal peptidase I
MDGDIVIVENFSAGMHVPSFFFYLNKHLLSHEKGINRGDIMAFKHPLDERLYLKRVVALPGDKIFQEDKIFYLQIGADQQKTVEFAKKYHIKLAQKFQEYWLESPYTYFYKITHSDLVIGPKELIDYPMTVIPEHQYFFMGDLRDNSTDSRYFGPVKYQNIYYKVWFILRKSYTLEKLASIEQY